MHGRRGPAGWRYTASDPYLKKGVQNAGGHPIIHFEAHEVAPVGLLKSGPQEADGNISGKGAEQVPPGGARERPLQVTVVESGDE